MTDCSYEFLTKFFSEHLPFTPTAEQVSMFQSDLSLVSPFLMEAALIEVRAETKGYLLVYRPAEWRPAIFNVYNRKVAEHAQLFPVFHSFETAFRSTVAVTLERYYSHARWWHARSMRLRLHLEHAFQDLIPRGISLISLLFIRQDTVSRWGKSGIAH